ncbi:unnamed protein product [Phytophthora lilii]|uniref:Unnamed protein product n=1 Tax=Phytophthora lilii TaxID=2077276 RepID=A0A9W6TFB0_9STRA|nr:unnamed protein product [Phytophthora lilii]
MDIAAGYNQLEVVRWLHGHRDEGCTTFAMDEASRNGHLEMVRWLTDHRTEGCTNAAIDAAVGFGHFDVALYLHQAHKASGNVLEIVRDGGNQCKWEFADWLYAHDPKEIVGMVADLFR